MTNPIIKIHNLETGEEIERPMTTAELKEMTNKREIIQAEAEAKEAARQSALSKLAALGLTEDEIKAIAG